MSTTLKNVFAELLEKLAKQQGMYWLDYPNREVRASMMMFLMAEWAHVEPARTTPMVVHLSEAFEDDDPRPKVLVGINFSSESKSVDDWVMEG